MSKRDPKEGYTTGMPSNIPPAAYWVVAVIAAATLAAWAWNGAVMRTNKEADERRMERVAGDERALKQLAAGPATKAWTTPHGSLVEIRIPTDRFGIGIVSLQHCIVWRDAETRTSSMHCDAETSPAE